MVQTVETTGWHKTINEHAGVYLQTFTAFKICILTVVSAYGNNEDDIQ